MFKKWIDKIAQSDSSDAERSLDMRQVSVQLMLEVARSDSGIDEVERDAIIQSLLGKSSFKGSDLDNFMDESETAVESSISFHEHIRLVNSEFDHAQKIDLMEQMWQVAYADGKLDPLEEAFIRQLADLIYIKHRDFIRTKHRVMPS